MKTTKSVLTTLSILLVSVWSHVSGGAPLGTAFTYQGQLADDGSPANGTYELRFELYDMSEGGALSAGPVTNLNVAVSEGLFTTTIDFGSGVFDGTAYWLAIGVRSNGAASAFVDLAPRQPVTPSPYALYATVAPLADNAVTSLKIADASVESADLAGDSVTSDKIPDGSVLGADLANDTVTSVQLGDDIELGAANANGELTVWSDFSNVETIELDGAAHRISTFGSDGLEQIRLWGPSWGELWLNDLVGNQTTVFLTANSEGGGLLQLRDGSGSNRVVLAGPAAGGTLQLNDASGASSLLLDGNTGTVIAEDSVDVVTVIGGAVQGSLYANPFGAWLDVNDETGARAVRGGASNTGGGGFWFLYNSSGFVTVEIDGDDEGDPGVGAIEVRNAAGSTRVELDGDNGITDGGSISVYDADTTETVLIRGAASTTQGSDLQMSRANGTTTIFLDADSGGAAFMSLRDINGGNRINLDGDANSAAGGGVMTVFQGDGSTGVTVDGDAGNNNTGGALTVHNNLGQTRLQLLGEGVGTGGEINLFDDDGTETVEILAAEGAGGGSQIVLRNGTGTQTIEIDGDWGGTGDGRVVTDELQITGDGNVISSSGIGINRVPTANALEVAGTASKTTVGDWLANSDARIKQDIEPVTDALATLAKVRLVRFRYTDDYRAEHRGIEARSYLNVVAQEFREVFPEHVKSSGDKLPDGSEILQVDTWPLTIYSAAAVQELNQKLERKESELAELSQRLAALEQLVSRLDRNGDQANNPGNPQHRNQPAPQNPRRE